MPRFFVAASNIFGGTAYISAEETEHFRALRINKGECITVCDGAGTEYVCRIKDVSPSGTEAEIISSAPSEREPSIYCTVYAAMSKGDKLDTVVQKAVELGASGVVVFPSKRCVSRPDEKTLIKKTSRLQKIAEEAAKQSERGIIPLVSVAPSFSAAVEGAARADMPLFCYEDEHTVGIKGALESKPGFRSCSIFTGPEGGFEIEEAELAKSAGMISVSLGARIMRCETAPLAALAAVMFHTGNM